jgi:hypothetical protein
MADLRPNPKGAHLDLTQETLEFFFNAFTDLWNAAGEGTDTENGEPSIDELIDDGKGMQFLKDVNSSATHWKKAQDNFGTKLYKALPWQDGEMRVTAVHNKRGELKVDVRFWYDPDSSNA